MDDSGAVEVPASSHAVDVRRHAVAVLIEQAAALARAGFFVESSALMSGARAVMNAPTTDATVIGIGAGRVRSKS